MSVDIQTLKQLRSLTHAPLKDCKEALEEAGGNIEQAQEVLKQKGAIKAAKKADRATNEGRVVIKSVGDKTVGVVLACETDFVAKNDTFIGLADSIVDILADIEGRVASRGDLDAEKQEQIDKLLKDNFVTIGENMQVVDLFVDDRQGYIYTHPGDKVAAVVYYEGDEERAKEVALQVAAMQPSYLNRDEIPEADIQAMQEGYREEFADSGKPADIVDKIIDGKINKELSEKVLLEQVSIIDDGKSVKQQLGDTQVVGFVRYAIGQ